MSESMSELKDRIEVHTNTETARINALTRTLITERHLKEQHRAVAAANRKWAEDTEEMLEEAKRQLRKAEQKLDDVKSGYRHQLYEARQQNAELWFKVYALEEKWDKLRELANK